jgi:calcineurin-like phosphoesterase family protein
MFNFLELNQSDFNRLYITSDTHAYHKNLCSGSTVWDRGADRNFKDQFEMTDCLVKNINDTVGADDILINLGDWSFGGKDKVAEFRNRINCKNVATLFGNHDKNVWNNRDLFTWTGHYTEFRYNKVLYCLSHYPFASWNESGRGSVMCHGHCHNNLHTNLCRGRIFDMGLDNPKWEFKPVKFTDLHQIVIKTDIFVSDHHSGDLTGW